VRERGSTHYNPVVAGSTRRAALALAAAGIALSCGPSVSTIYEGNIRFEHCYRLDLDRHIAPTHRAACWREWEDRYTYGQTRDRLEYAKRRLGSLATGDAHRPELRFDEPDGGAPESPSEAPAPTSVHAPPPPLSKSPEHPSEGSADAGKPEAPEAGPEPPGAACTAECRDDWKSCLEPCTPDAGAKRRACKACDADYGRCVQRCLK
jgi:hypothetical protein